MKTTIVSPRIFLAFGAVFLALSGIGTPAAKAADQPNVLIMGEDADEDTVPRHSRIFNRVSDALRTRMMELGFKVYNETAVTMNITMPTAPHDIRPASSR